jgi:hypothetical protein
MQLTRHLSTEDLSEVILDSDQQQLRRTLNTLPESASVATEHPNAFWERQQAQIRKRVAAVPVRSSTRAVTAWAGAFALILLATSLLRNSDETRPSRVQSDPDQELLVAVEQTLQSGIPQALEPAAILADEINSSSQPIPTSRRSYKENRNENQ